MSDANISTSQPLLTVAITNYNYGKYLGRCLSSVLGQTFRDFEIVVVDNASTDNSVALLEEYAARDSRIRIITHAQNMGLNYSLRESCDLARGKYCVHLDPDDWILDPQAFERQLQILESDPEIVFVYSARAFTNQQGHIWLSKRPHRTDTILAGEKEVENSLSWFVGHSGPMFRLSAYRAMGGYAPGISHGIEGKLPADLCSQGKVGYINRPLYVALEHTNNLHGQAPSRQMIDELIQVAESVLQGPIAARLPDLARVRRRILARIYFRMSAYYIHSNELRTGWQLLRQSIQVNPTWVLRQRGLILLLAKALIVQLKTAI